MTAALLVLTTLVPVFAQSDTEETEVKGAQYPLQLIHLAGIDRLHTKLDGWFLAADRPELSDVVQNWITESAKDFPGVDRTKPLGLMLYIKPGLVPSVTTVTYVPVTDVKKLLNYLAGSEGSVKDVTGSPHQFEIVESLLRIDFAVKVDGDYAFIVSQDDAAELDRRFPNPQRLVSPLQARYDIAYSLLIKNVPPATRTLFLEFFKNQAQAGLQRRDNEPEAAYQIRRANGESLIDFLDLIVNNGEELTIGTFSNEDSTSYVEIELKSRKDSGLAKFCQDLAGRRTYFDNLLDQSSTLSVSTSVQLDEKRRKPLVELFRLATTLIAEGLKKELAGGGSIAEIQPFFQSLQNTAEDGHLDFFYQLTGSEPFESRILGGFRILSTGSLPNQLENLLKFAKSLAPKAGGASRPILDSIKLNDSKIDGHAVHAIPLKSPAEGLGQAMFGDDPSLYLCATPQALWFAFGQKSALEHLQTSITTVGKPADPTQPKKPAYPFRLTTHASNWINAGLATGVDVSESAALEASTLSFEDGNDLAEITLKPTDNGFQFRFQFEPGYFSWTGRMVSKQFDDEQARAADREKRRQERQKAREQRPAAP